MLRFIDQLTPTQFKKLESEAIMAKAERFKRPEDWSNLSGYLSLVLGAVKIVGGRNVVTEDLKHHCEKDGLAVIRVGNSAGEEVLWKCPGGNLRTFVSRLRRAGLSAFRDYMVLYPYHIPPSGPD